MLGRTIDRSGFWRRFRRDQRGTPSIEFAFGAPILFTMLVAVIEVGMMLFVTTLMERCASRTVERRILCRVFNQGASDDFQCEGLLGTFEN